MNSETQNDSYLYLKIPYTNSETQKCLLQAIK